jgi:hypothetical protein
MSKSRNLGKIPRERFDGLRQVLQDYGRQIMNFHLIFDEIMSNN